MGSIASVLQWHCSGCALINPTERARCAKCGLSRRDSDERARLRAKRDQDDGSGESEGRAPTPPPRRHRDLLLLCARQKTQESQSNSLVKLRRYGSWCGRHCVRQSFERSPSLPTLVAQWTCIRCLLENSCSAAPICTACGASASISQIHAEQVGARRCKRLNISKPNSLKLQTKVDWITKVTTGLVTRILDTSTNTVHISKEDDKIKIKGMAQLTGISRSERSRPSREDWTLPPVESLNLSAISYVDNVESSQRSPKRHSPSMYERVKSKVSRSLSNGSVVQKLSERGLQRPTSLLVSEASHRGDVTWSCDNCTLDNVPELEHCEACGAPRSPAPCSGVVISVPAWEPKALTAAGPLSYRRSYSEIESVTNIIQRKVNRRSLNDEEPPAVPPHSAEFNSKPKYSYIGTV